MEKTIKAKAIMINNDYKLVVVKDDIVLYFSYDRGIKPIYDVYTNNPEFLKGAYISDRVTGKAAAMILSNAGIAGIYTELISEQAIKIFMEHDIVLSYEKKVDYILNRDKTGSCPIERISKDLNSEDTSALVSGIKNFLESI